MTDIILELPETLRGELKAPLGPIYTDPTALLQDATEPILSVGDVVTHHLLSVGCTPAVALVDDYTERKAVDPAVAQTITDHDGFDRRVTAENPPATLSKELLEELAVAVKNAPDSSTLIEVDGEEDLAALPAVVIAPVGASVVYGQTGEGMVLGTVDERLQDEIRDLLSRMDGDITLLWELLDSQNRT